MAKAKDRTRSDNGNRAKRWSRIAAAGLLLAAAGLLLLRYAGRRNGLSVAPGSLRGSNVLLITIDTLRADRLGSYGNANGLTPNLDKMAKEGVRFAQVYSHVPLTFPAHASILTGLLPISHGVRNNTSFRLGETPTLATMLKPAGYRTGAFVGAFVLDARFGLSRDFDVYDDFYGHVGESAEFRIAERRADRVVEPASSWILQPAPGGADATTPWIAWIHLYDPHAPYEAPAEYRSGRSPYDAEVAFTDAMIGRLVSRLRDAGQLARTLVVVTGDHGESLGEHGESTHGLFAYNATLSVPLFLSGPGLTPRVISAPVAHVDLVPTVLDLVGVPAPPGLDGRSLLDAAASHSSSRAIYFEALDANLTRDWAPLSGLVADGWKYIDLPIPELYDLNCDPTEARNLAARDLERVRVLSARLKEVISRAPSTHRATTTTLDAETAARLASLGYVGSTTAGVAKRTFGERDDPKNLVRLDESFSEALRAQNEGRPDSALAELRAIVAKRPDFVAAWTSAATILIGAGRPDQALELLAGAPGDVASVPVVRWRRGLAFEAKGDLPSAAKELEAASGDEAANAEIANSLGVLYARQGRVEDARRRFRQVIAADPSAAGTWNNLGILEMGAGNHTAAAEAFREAVRSDPSYGEAWRGLGAALVQTDRPGAIDAWQRAVELAPRDFDTLFNLAVVLTESDRPERALAYLRRFAAEAPPERYRADIVRVEAMIVRIKRIQG